MQYQTFELLIIQISRFLEARMWNYNLHIVNLEMKETNQESFLYGDENGHPTVC